MTFDDYLILGGFGLAGFFLFAIYFLPTTVAFLNRHHQKEAIAVLNVLLGWTLIGWAIALVWAFMRQPAGDA